MRKIILITSIIFSSCSTYLGLNTYSDDLYFSPNDRTYYPYRNYGYWNYNNNFYNPFNYNYFGFGYQYPQYFSSPKTIIIVPKKESVPNYGKRPDRGETPRPPLNRQSQIRRR